VLLRVPEGGRMSRGAFQSDTEHKWQPAGHPVLHLPTYWDIEALAEVEGCTQAQAFTRYDRRRKEIIDGENGDPLRLGWEPPIWKVADALLGLPFCDARFTETIKARFGMTWGEWAEAMRKALGFEREVNLLLILGANRSSKSEYAVKRCQLTLSDKPGSRVYAFHQSHPRSVRDQQPLFMKYMPAHYRKQTATMGEYIKWKLKTGFSDDGFITPILSECVFSNYSQDRDTALEGIEADMIWDDELVPPDWVDTQKYRLATRGGKGIVTFTPVRGYSPTVKMFCDSAKITRESIAFLLPRDGGEPDVARALGLTPEEYREILDAHKEKRAARAPQSRPEDCLAWIENPDADPATIPNARRPYGHARSQPAPPAGRAFASIERVMRPVDPEMGVIFFHGADNPYGNPKEVFRKARHKGAGEIRIRCYGRSDKAISNIIRKFSQRIHTVPPEAVPAAGTNWMVMDPASDRNFFMTWIRAVPEADYAYREWPGSYEIPGIGIPDPWAVPSGKKEGVNDGARGRGAQSFGFGLFRYKFEIARVERWEDYMRWLRDSAFTGDIEARARAVLSGALYPLDDELDRWDERNGAEEVVTGRLVDSRAASSPRVEHDRPVTLYEELKDLGMDFELTPGASIEDGVAKLNTALDYDLNEAMSFFNKPRLFIARTCVNTIFALENWMNADGEKGATKDPVDNLRYYYTGECGYEDDAARAPRGGFHYGAGNQPHFRGGDRIEHPIPRRRPACMDADAQRAVFRNT
jgi:hypothetical protein